MPDIEPAAAMGEAPATPARSDEPRGIEPARLVRFLRPLTYVGGAILASGSFLLGLPLHRWPRVAMAVTYYTITGLSLLVAAGLAWAELRREPPESTGDDQT